MVVPEPGDGRFVLVGDDPGEVVAVRHDRADGGEDRWYRLLGVGSTPVTYAEVTAGVTVPGMRCPEQARVVPLYTEAQAVQDLVLPAVRVMFERYLQESRVERDAEGHAVPAVRRAQYVQAALAVRGLAQDLAARAGLPVPEFRVDGMVSSDAPTQVIARVDDSQDVSAVQAQVPVMPPNVTSAEQSGRWRWRTPQAVWWPWGSGGRPVGRHRMSGRSGGAAMSQSEASG